MLVFIKVLLFVSIPTYAFFRMFLNYVNEKSVKIKAIDVYASMIIYCLFMLGFFLNKAAAGAGERLHIFERTGIKDNGYASLANEYVVSVYDQLLDCKSYLWGSSSADIIYLIMKPLEWLFLIVLYTVDKKPENRIHKQYSELRK